MPSVPLTWGVNDFGSGFYRAYSSDGLYHVDRHRTQPPTNLAGFLSWSIDKETGSVGLENHIILLHTERYLDSVLYCSDRIHYLSSRLWSESERMGEDYG